MKKHDHLDELDKELKSMPKPPLEEHKKYKVHETIMSATSSANKEERSFSQKYIHGLGGFAAVAALLLFVYGATMFLGESDHRGDEGTGLPIEEEATVYEFLFEGESEHWYGEYYYYGEETVWRNEAGVPQHLGNHSYQIVVTYKGELVDLESIDFIEINWSQDASGGSMTRSISDGELRKKEFASSGGGSGGRNNINKDQVIEVTVKWAGLEESFELVVSNSDQLDQWENRGPAMFQLTMMVQNYLLRKLGPETDIYSNTDYDWDEELGRWVMVVAMTEAIHEDWKEDILEIVDGKVPVEFIISRYTNEELSKKQEELAEQMMDENMFESYGFEVQDIFINQRENKVQLGIKPYTEENAQIVHHYFGEEMIHITEAMEFEEPVEDSIP
ncbi:hypothetical protein [Evansella tamaricis]|uniref:Uncharacterized protein n=1 Tax=Evansella tamaricis TaxID=2069301 RepID=A0ABS6JI01_9BACI|nr:hypothetical protein [Evansella tamaricis]MBU9712492.1 hypothetical protein [Evansella tamaricis]